jgi:hypothetical protein
MVQKRLAAARHQFSTTFTNLRDGNITFRETRAGGRETEATQVEIRRSMRRQSHHKKTGENDSNATVAQSALAESQPLITNRLRKTAGMFYSGGPWKLSICF